MLIIPPKGVSGYAITVSDIAGITFESDRIHIYMNDADTIYHWTDYPSDTDMEEEFHRACNEVNSLLTKPTIQL